MKVPSEPLKNLRGGVMSYWPPKKTIFCGFWGAHNFPPSKFSAFLSKNNGTFIRQIFHFLSESILIFFIFDQKEPKISVLSFKFFIKKPKNLNFPFTPQKIIFQELTLR